VQTHPSLGAQQTLWVLQQQLAAWVAGLVVAAAAAHPACLAVAPSAAAASGAAAQHARWAARGADWLAGWSGLQQLNTEGRQGGRAVMAGILITGFCVGLGEASSLHKAASCTVDATAVFELSGQLWPPKSHVAPTTCSPSCASHPCHCAAAAAGPGARCRVNVSRH